MFSALAAEGLEATVLTRRTRREWPAEERLALEEERVAQFQVAIDEYDKIR